MWIDSRSFQIFCKLTKVSTLKCKKGRKCPIAVCNVQTCCTHIILFIFSTTVLRTKNGIMQLHIKINTYASKCRLFHLFISDVFFSSKITYSKQFIPWWLHCSEQPLYS